MNDHYGKNIALSILVILLCATIGWAMLERSNRQHLDASIKALQDDKEAAVAERDAVKQKQEVDSAELLRCDDRLREISQEAAKPDAPPQEAEAPTPHVGP